MPGENSALINRAVDVGIIVPCCFESQMKQKSELFVERAPAQGRGARLGMELGNVYFACNNYIHLVTILAKVVQTELDEKDFSTFKRALKRRGATVKEGAREAMQQWSRAQMQMGTTRCSW